MCQPRGSQRAQVAGGCTCGCCRCGCGTFFRRFVSAKEEQERLEEYRDQLEKELAGVEDRIQELKGK
ncbi:MAG TPA: hypothetical protein ACFYEK_14975 [Candidatus Wunengus sp. YC60]|uniref:hypothetical protein n=1 Tax=Candidatus Wunengus sp. YC60 TaxID=3367697 RepID=UPI004028986D